MSTMMIELQPLRRDTSAWVPAQVASQRPSHEVFVRRRAVAVLMMLCLFAIAGLTIRSWSGPAGGNPASVSGRDPATSEASAAGGQAAGSVGPEAGATIVVQAGDSLWSIAQEIIGDGDIARYVDRLVDLNGDDALVVGQALLLPA